MKKEVTFIGRETELCRFWEIVCDFEKERQIVFIEADGGVGKTRLLQEFFKKHKHNDKNIFITPIVDFDDGGFSHTRDLGQEIAKKIGSEHFGNFYQKLSDYEAIRGIEGISAKKIDEERYSVRKAWIDDFSQFSVKNRVILLFDTIDENVLLNQSLNIIEIFANSLKNIVLFIAGRNAADIKKYLFESLTNISIEHFSLPCLPSELAEEYLMETGDLRHTKIPEELKEKILFLSKGKPILLGLSVEWVAQNEPPTQWLFEAPLSNLKDLSLNYQRQFEYSLVNELAQERTNIKKLTLVLSHIYPLDTNSIKSLFSLSQQESEELFDEAKKLFFVKPLAEGKIKLHDEMQRMIENYVWKDLSDTARSDYSKDFVKYIDSHILKYIGEDVIIPDNLTKSEEDALKLKLKHTLFFDIAKGVHFFKKLFVEAKKKSGFTFFSLQQTIFETIKPYMDKLDETQLYEIEHIRCQYLAYCGEYQTAKKLADNMLKKPLSNIQKVRILIQISNIDVRLNNLEQAFNYAKESLEISVNENLREQQYHALLLLGWICRLFTDYEQAMMYYRASLKLSIRHLGANIINKEMLGRLHNNLAYVYALVKNREKAFNMCTQAEELWGEEKFERGAGIIHSTLGRIYIEFDQFDEAIKEFTKALDIFHSKDREWLSTVYLGRSRAYRLLAIKCKIDSNERKEYLTLVKNDLSKALEFDMPRDKQEYYYQLGSYYYYNGDIEDSMKTLKECYELSEISFDFYHQVMSLQSQARIYVIIKRDTSQIHFFSSLLDEIETKYKYLLEKYNIKLSRLPIALLQRYLGDMNLLQKNLEEALRFYKLSLPDIAKYGRHSPVNIKTHLDSIQYNILKSNIENDKLDIDLAHRLGSALDDFWIEKEYDIDYPEVLLYFGKWQSGEVDKWE